MLGDKGDKGRRIPSRIPSEATPGVLSSESEPVERRPNSKEETVPERLAHLRALTDQLDDLTEIVYDTLNRLPDLVCIWKGRRIVFANRAFTEVLGYTQEEVQDGRWVDFVHPDDVERTAELARQGVAIEGLENRWMTKDGAAVPLRWVSSAPSSNGYALAIGTVVGGGE